jgi:hypothetical protein
MLAGRVLPLILAPAAVAACCVAPPDTRELLAVGFRTPDQAFASFQTAVRADDPGLLRRCLSADFVARNRLSEQVFRTFWQKLEKDQPLLRKGVADAEARSPTEIAGGRARIRAETHGRKLEIELVREDFCEAFAGGEKIVDEAVPFRERTGVQPASDGTNWAFGRLALPPGAPAESVTELRFGREWKIDSFRIEEDGRKRTPGDTLSAGDALP